MSLTLINYLYLYIKLLHIQLFYYSLFLLLSNYADFPFEEELRKRENKS